MIENQPANEKDIGFDNSTTDDHDVKSTSTRVVTPEEKSALRKIDLRLLLFLIPIYLLFNMDRSSIGYARLQGIEKTLDVTPEQYPWILSIFHIGYIAFEVPSNLLLRVFSPGRWMTFIIIACSITTICMGAAFNFAGIMTARFFLGVFEAGFFPGMILLIATWYTRQEQGFRIAIVTSASTLAGVISGPVALALKNMNGLGGLEGWRWIFIIEGVPSLILGFFAWWIIPGSPATANWLTPDEKAVVEKRMRESHVEITDKKFDVKQFIDAIKDYKTFLFILMKLGISIPLKSITELMPTIINDMGFSTTQTMFLTAPPYIIGLILKLIMSWTSDKTMQRGYHIYLSLIIGIFGYFLQLVSSNHIVRYIGLNLAQAGPLACYPLVISWVNNNIIGATKAPTTIALVIMMGTVGGIGGGQLYRHSEAPNYYMSQSINIGFLILSFLSAIILRFFLYRENKKLDQIESNDKEFNLQNPNPNPKFRYVL